MYCIAGLLLVPYLALWVYFAALFEPNLQFFSYYAVNYDRGFIRRGLAGEILDLFGPDHYFTGLVILRWSVPVLFAISLAALAWTVASTRVTSERRLMLALLIPMLPFGIVRAVVLPTPDLLGEAALAIFVVALTRGRTDRSALVASCVYGVTTAALTLIHEAIPFLQALGAILAIVILVRGSSRTRQLSGIAAVLPGVVVALAIALLGRQDASAHCDRLPHNAVDFPILLSPGEILRGTHAYTDYHEWTCRFITVTTRSTPLSALNDVGWAPWVSSTLTGAIILTATLVLIRVVSGVPLTSFLDAARAGRVWMIVSVLLLLAVFATSSDWARWWTATSFNAGAVYLVFASTRSESARPADRRTRVWFGTSMVVLALFPVAVGFTAATMVRPLIAQCDTLSHDPQWVGICP